MPVYAGNLSLRTSGSRILIGVRARPGAKATRVVGVYGDRLKIDVAAPAEANKANDELVRAVARWIGVPPDRVILEVGHAGRDKVLAVEGLDETAVRERLESVLAGPA